MTSIQSLLRSIKIGLMLLLLVACVTDAQNVDVAHTHVTSHSLSGGDIIAQAPQNFCVDLSTRTTRNFVLMLNCDLLTERAKTAPASRRILTVSTSGLVRSQLQASDLKSSLGEGSILSSRVDGLVMRQITDANAPRLPGAAPEHWRGVMLMNSRIVSFAVYRPESGASIGLGDRRKLEELAAKTIAASQTKSRASTGQ